MPGGPHPFVREAAQLAVLALKTGLPAAVLLDRRERRRRPGGFPQHEHETTQRKHRLWIPPSAGWTALNGRAQQLVADVLLLLNLADRGDQPHEQRAAAEALEPDTTCRRASPATGPSLDPGLTVGTATSSAPGTSCVDGCRSSCARIRRRARSRGWR